MVVSLRLISVCLGMDKFEAWERVEEGSETERGRQRERGGGDGEKGWQGWRRE